jgi:hypothetical protein
MRARFVATLPCVLGVVVAVGCGDNLPGAAGSGTRLALHSYVFEDGTELVDPTRFRDLARGEDCTPALWSDGASYCTPAAGDLVYTDPQCLTQVAHVPAGSAAAYFVKPFFAGREPLISRLVHLGAPFGAANITYHLDSGTCLSTFESSAGTLYATDGAEETSDAFARVRHLPTAGDGRFAAERDSSDDGMSVPVGLLDTALGIECVVDGHDAATAACAPRSRITAQFYGDDACTRLVAETDSLVTPDAIESLDACPRYFAIGDAVPNDPLWDGSTGACFMTTAPAGPRYFAASNELVLGEVARTPVAGAKRLQLVALADPALRLYDTFVHDTELGADCAPAMLGGTLRCVPPTPPRIYTMLKFDDQTCGAPLEIAYVPSQPCNSTTAYALSADGSIHHLGGEYSGQLFEISTGDICAPAPTPAGTTPHALGNPLPESMFLAVTAR